MNKAELLECMEYLEDRRCAGRGQRFATRHSHPVAYRAFISGRLRLGFG